MCTRQLCSPVLQCRRVVAHQTSDRSGRVRFGRFDVDLDTGELRRDGIRIRLQDRPFQVLRALVARPGELVTRDELRQQLWGPDTFVDFDNSLNTAVTKLREALGDTAEDHRFIETLARRGYRFVAPVTRGEPGDTASEQPSPAPRRWSGVAAVFGLAAIVAVALTAALMPRGASSAGSDRVRIAVLPFENLSGDSSQEFLSDGFTEETIGRLGQLYANDLGVIARTSSMAYKGTRKGVDEIANELQVEYVVEGSLRLDGDRLLVTAQLIRTADQTHVWANTYDRGARDVLQIQREVVRSIAEAVHARLTSPSSAAAGPPDPRGADPEAYELYLKGRYLWNQRTVPSIQAALDYFQQAIARQPRNAQAYTGLAYAYINLGSTGAVAIGETHPKARAAALKALELDETAAEAHTALAALIADYYWDWPQVEVHFKRALALNPSDVTTHHWYSEHLARLGRVDESIREAEAARQVDPLSPIANVILGHQLARARRYDEAIARHRQSLELFPNFGPLHSALGFAYSFQGRPREALEHFERFAGIIGEAPDAVGLLGFAHARAGDVARARQCLDTLDRLAAKQHVSPIARAVIYLGLNDADAALTWLDRAVDERNWQAGMFGHDPLYDSLRKDPRFDALVRRVGLPRSN